MGLDDTLTGQTFVEGKTKVLKHADLVHVLFRVTKKALELGVRSSCFIPLLTAKYSLGSATLSRLLATMFSTRKTLAFLSRWQWPWPIRWEMRWRTKPCGWEEERLRVLGKTGPSAWPRISTSGRSSSSISAHGRHLTHHEFASLRSR